MIPRGPELDAEVREQAEAPPADDLAAIVLALASAVIDLERRLARVEQRDQYR